MLKVATMVVGGWKRQSARRVRSAGLGHSLYRKRMRQRGLRLHSERDELTQSSRMISSRREQQSPGLYHRFTGTYYQGRESHGKALAPPSSNICMHSVAEKRQTRYTFRIFVVIGASIVRNVNRYKWLRSNYCTFSTGSSSRVTLDLGGELPTHFVTHPVGRTNLFCVTSAFGNISTPHKRVSGDPKMAAKLT